ncbi:unnamed protein product [Chrysoparadoxa australica]
MAEERNREREEGSPSPSELGRGMKRRRRDSDCSELSEDMTSSESDSMYNSHCPLGEGHTDSEHEGFDSIRETKESGTEYYVRGANVGDITDSSIFEQAFMRVAATVEQVLRENLFMELGEEEMRAGGREEFKDVQGLDAFHSGPC